MSASHVLVCIEPSVGLAFSVSLLHPEGQFTSISLTALDIEEERLTSSGEEEFDIFLVPGSDEHLVIKVIF